MSKRQRSQLDELDRLDVIAALLDEDYTVHDILLLGDASIQCSLCASTVDIIDVQAHDWDAEVRRVEQCVVMHINTQSHARLVDPVLEESCPIVINGIRVVCPSYLVDVVALAGPGRTLYSMSLAAILIPNEEGNIRVHAFHMYELVELETPSATTRPPSDLAPPNFSCSTHARHFTKKGQLSTLRYLDTFPRRYPTDSDWHLYNFNKKAELAMKRAQSNNAHHHAQEEKGDSTNVPERKRPGPPRGEDPFRRIPPNEVDYWARFHKEEEKKKNPVGVVGHQAKVVATAPVNAIVAVVVADEEQGEEVNNSTTEGVVEQEE